LEIAFVTQTLPAKNTTKPVNSLKIQIKKVMLKQQPLEVFSKLQKKYQTTDLLDQSKDQKSSHNTH